MSTDVKPWKVNTPSAKDKRKALIKMRQAAKKPVDKHLSLLDKAMTVDKNIVDELLLVCSVIGTTDENDNVVPVTDCLQWLQDLQRAMRRDDDLYRPVSLLLGHWKVVEQKLIPLALSCRYDSSLILTICKILVILTKPLADNTKRAGTIVINTKKKRESSEVTNILVQEQIKMRDNALKQAEQLLEYKRIICRHASQMTSNSSEGGSGGILSIFVSLLAEPLSKSGNSRTDADHLTIELVLHLFRNLLSAEPLLHGTDEHKKLHFELVALLESELVLDILLVLAADIEQRENAQYNLLLMELLHFILQYQDPTAVAKCGDTPNAANKTGQTPVASQGLLQQKLKQERNAAVALASSRHAHFAGCVQLSNKRLQSTHLLGKNTGLGPTAPKRRKTNFVGSNNCLTQNSSRTVSGSSGVLLSRSQKVIYRFCDRFVKECYGPVMKSLKNEFRRDSVRLEESDKVMFFRLVWFFYQWWRQNTTVDKNTRTMGQLVFTMDVYTFNLLLSSTDSFEQHKKYANLAQAVSLLSEMMHMLIFMYNSKEETERIMALGLMDRLYYGDDPLDRLPKFFSRWKPGTSTREHLCDLVESCHLQLKLLETNAKACKTVGEEDKKDTVVKMKAAAAEFDVNSYFARKIVSNHTVSLYTQLLAQYETNSTNVNHRIVAFFLRMCKLRIAVAEPRDPDIPANPLTGKTVTLQPMLYSTELFQILNSVLNNTSIQGISDFSFVVKFATDLVYQFSLAANDNPLLFVELLFTKPIPHRFCESVTNMYVDEELRMVAEREILLEEQRKLELAENSYGETGPAEDEEEEMEFDGNEVINVKTSKAAIKRRVIADSDDEDDNSDEIVDDDENDVNNEEGIGADEDNNDGKDVDDAEDEKNGKNIDEEDDDNNKDKFIDDTAEVTKIDKESTLSLPSPFQLDDIATARVNNVDDVETTECDQK